MCATRPPQNPKVSKATPRQTFNQCPSLPAALGDSPTDRRDTPRHATPRHATPHRPAHARTDSHANIATNTTFIHCLLVLVLLLLRGRPALPLPLPPPRSGRALSLTLNINCFDRIHENELSHTRRTVPGPVMSTDPMILKQPP